MRCILFFGKRPYEWQQNVLEHLKNMVKNCLCIPLLLVHPTGGGKSGIRDTFAILQAGVTLTVTPLPLLGSDENYKIFKNASSEHGIVTSFHLDEVKGEEAQKALTDKLGSLPSDVTKTVLLFISPQALQNNAIRQASLLFF